MERNTPLSCKTPILRDTIRTAMESYGVPWRSICYDAGRSPPALHRDDFGPQAAMRVVMLAARVPSLPGRAVTRAAAAGRHASLRIQDRL
jgi:hypothetical protein